MISLWIYRIAKVFHVRDISKTLVLGEKEVSVVWETCLCFTLFRFPMHWSGNWGFVWWWTRLSNVQLKLYKSTDSLVDENDKSQVASCTWYTTFMLAFNLKNDLLLLSGS